MSETPRAICMILAAPAYLAMFMAIDFEAHPKTTGTLAFVASALLFVALAQ